MSSKKSKWYTIFKHVEEKFELLPHESYNIIPTSSHELQKEIFDTDFNVICTIPLHPISGGKTSVPYVINKNKIKHVEVGYFTPCGDVIELEEKEWLKESVKIVNSALVRRTTLVLEKNEDKVKLSLFNFRKSRSVGHRYFSKEMSDLHITFNLKSKNFYITISTFKNRRRITKTYKNDFSKIVNVIYPLKFTNPHSPLFHPIIKKTINELFPVIPHSEVLTKLKNELELKIEIDSELNTSPGRIIGEIITKWFVKVWGIKTPNNYNYYLLKHYPGIKKLRKYGMNLIHTILNERNLNGKFYNKLLNTNSECNVTDLNVLQYILGEDGVKRIHPIILAKSNNFMDNKFTECKLLIGDQSNDLSKYEKNNIVKIYNNFKCTQVYNFIDLLLDHLRTKRKLQEYGIHKKIKCKTIDDFNDEHSEWSNLLHECERTTQVNYVYPNSFLNHMENTIQLDGDKYFVKVLKNDNDYFEEGQVQHHCVRTYLDKYKSIIVSIRKDHENGMERMTCEFVTQSKTNHSVPITDYSDAPSLVQARMKYNKNPENDWEVVMRLVRKEFLDYVCKPKNNARPVIKITNSLTNHTNVLKYEPLTDTYLNNEEIVINDIPPTTFRHNLQNNIIDDLPF